MSIKKQPDLWFISIFIFVFTSGLLLIALPVPVTEAGTDLPDRNTPTPARSSESDEDDNKDSGPVGAYIELQVQNAPAGAWSVVQWQNELGDWYDVEGWRGSLDGNGYRCWWVAEKDFGTEPFQWVVRSGQDGPVLGVSQAFNLPGGANETVQVNVTIK